MKKLIIVIGLFALLLVGCSDANANVSSGKEVVIKIGDYTYTKADLYAEMLEADQAATVINEALRIILAKEIETTDELQATAKTEYDKYLEQLGDDYEEYLYQLGCKSLDELNEMCLTNAKHDELYKREILENYDTLINEYAPFKAKILFFDGSTESEAAIANSKEALELLKAGSSIEDLQAKYKTTESLAKDTLYTGIDSSLDKNVLTWINSQTTPGTSDIITNTAGTGYYIVRITTKNAEQVKDDFVSYLQDDSDYVASVETKYFKKYNFEIFDITVYDFVKENYEQYLVQ